MLDSLERDRRPEQPVPDTPPSGGGEPQEPQS